VFSIVANHRIGKILSHNTADYLKGCISLLISWLSTSL
jgi:hypothetical protein